MVETTPRERIQLSIRHKQPSRVPWHFGCTTPTRLLLENYYGTTDLDTILDQNIVKFRSRLPYVEIRPDFVRDEFGLIWNRTIDKNIGIVEKHPLQERSLKGVNFPDPHDSRRLEALPEFLEANPNRYRLFSLGFSLFERAWTLRGMEDILVDMLQDPGICR